MWAGNRREVVIKLVDSASSELKHLATLSLCPELHVVPILEQAAVSPAYTAVVMPKLAGVAQWIARHSDEPTCVLDLLHKVIEVG